MRAVDDAVGKHAEEVLLDDVGLVVFDAFEPVRDEEPVADFLGPRLDEVKLRRVGEPAASSAAASSAPARSRGPGGIRARNATPGVKHAAIADAS